MNTINGIRGNVVGTPMKRPDFNNPKSILNNPIPPITEADEGKIVAVKGGKYVLTEMPEVTDTALLAEIDTLIGEGV